MWPKLPGRSQKQTGSPERHPTVIVFELEMLTNPFKGKQKFFMVLSVNMFYFLNYYNVIYTYTYGKL